jgi:hypothetical protein
MDDSSPPQIVSADLVDNGAVIEFSDGQRAFFPAALLYAALPQATEIRDSENLEPPK